MGYSLDEWFDDHAFPKIKEFVESKKESDQTSRVEAFILMLNDIFSEGFESRKEQFASLLLMSILAPNEDEEFYEILQNCFVKLSSDIGKNLEKIIYTDCGTRITCDFVQDNEEITD